MKKMLMFVFIFSFLCTEPYKPYPILFIHGYTSNAGTWGADWDKDNRTDTLKGPGKGTYKFFLDKMTPYCIVWDAIDKTYTKPSDTSRRYEPILYPNKSFLEVFNANYPLGSIDGEEVNDVFPGNYQKGGGYEIGERIEKVLKEYYGDDWRNDLNGGVIFIVCRKFMEGRDEI